VIGALGNPAFQSETLVNTEVGYRVEIGSTASVDVAVFHGRYDNLKTSEPLAPRLELTPARRIFSSPSSSATCCRRRPTASRSPRT